MDTFERTFAEGEQPAKETTPAETPATEQPKAEEPKAETPPVPETKPAETPGESKEPPKAEPEKPRVDSEQFKGYLDERDKRQAAERRAEEAERRLAAQQQQQPKEPPPDFYEQPEARLQLERDQFTQELTKQKLSTSEFLARREHGAELLDKVKAWAVTLPPERANALIAEASPFHAAIDAYRQDQAFAQLKAHDFDIEKLVADRMKQQPAPAAVAQTPPPTNSQPPPANLPPKIAGEGGLVGKDPVITDEARFDRAFR